MILIGAMFVIMYSDVNRLPSTPYVLARIASMLSTNGDCEICGDVLRTLDSFQYALSTPLLRATEGYDKPQSAFLRACEENPSSFGCDTALDRNRAEKIKRVAVVISRVEQYFASQEPRGAALLHRRYDEFVEYLLAEKEQEECTTCIADDGLSPRLVTNPLTESFLGNMWFHFFPINERHQAFCWQHCEGSLAIGDRFRLWLLRFYVTYAVRFRLMALQREYGTIVCVLLQFTLLLAVLQTYVGEERATTPGSGGGGGGKNNNNNSGVGNNSNSGGNGGGSLNAVGNGHTEVSAAVPVSARAGARRSVLARGKGGGGKRD
ncbi:uncharacterized protein TM35_000063290 [Trypanosoma theileri]|uniref:Uncharacterized protein n=1 Tax=Trypanosoma theileri TaxID=67003 RepID=A0A1X0P309_9TRYP|nr:uncharacterized protein TM35_000063290 [Trypanosoma theileri]ORC91324.1 hypothetical protein TM35_000063290 [Trypanosoma theileri]